MAQGTPEGRTSQYRESLVVGQDFSTYKLFKVVCIPEALLHYGGLSLGAKVTYGRLMRYAGEDGDAFPAVGTLAKEICVSINQARRYLQELTAGRFIRIVSIQGKPNHYKFIWHEVFASDAGTGGSPSPAAPLPSMGGVKTEAEKKLSTSLPVPPTALPLPSVGGAPLPSVGGAPLPSVGDEESQCKESQGKRVSLSAREYEIVHGAIEHALGEIPSSRRTDGLIYDMLRHGRQHGLPPHALARFITWEVHERKIARGYRRIEVGLVHKMVLEDSVLWAKREANTVFRFQMEEEEWLANWLTREKAARKMPLSSEKPRASIGKTENRMA